LKNKRRRGQVGRDAQRRGSVGRIQVGDEDRDENVRGQKILRGRDNVAALPEDASQAELGAETRPGRVVAIRGSDAFVESVDGSETVVCRMRKSTRIPHPGESALTVGDDVVWIAEGTPPFVLTEVGPRRTKLVRLRRGHETHVICANVDFGVVVASADDPSFKPRLVDRYLIAAGQGGLVPMLVLNKIDLLRGESAASLLSPYAALDVHAFAVSATTGEGIEALVGALKDRTSVFSGQSGVGKTSLLNHLIPDLAARTQQVQKGTGKGRHTTTTSTLYRFPFGGAVVDTPGVRAFALYEPTLADLEKFFPEVVEAARACRFSDCRHAGEAGCAVPDAIAAGRIVRARFESFLALSDEITGH
jgi:ribosome biogenesis GTPase